MADSVINFATDKVLGPIMALLMEYTIKRIRYIKEYRKIAIELKETVQKLKDSKDDFQVKVQNDEIDKEEKRTKTAQGWLDKVDETLKNNELEALIKEADEIKNKKDDKCCLGCCHGSLELGKRFTFGQKASEKLEEIRKLLTPPTTGLTEKVLGHPVKQKLEELLSQKWNSREKLKNNLIAKVLDGQVVHHVGLCGPKGVGKTTLVKEITREKQVKEAFQKIVMVLMGDSPILKDVQNKIAKSIGAELNDEDKIELNAVALEHHIRKKKENILIILDDLWAKEDLNSLGTGRNNEYCKHLIVTKSENVCKLMDIQEDSMLRMELMTDEEAIGFFWNAVYETKRKNRMVDQITSYAYISLANKLIFENCGGAPNVVAALANYLANLEIRDWKKLDVELRCEKSVEEKKQKILDKNYNRYKTHEKEKQTFSSLGCVFQPETSIPIYEWMRYAIGLDLFQNVDSLSEAMSIADTWIQDMISSSLLEEEEKGYMGGLGHVTIPRHVRDQLKKTSLDGQIELLDDIRRWTDLETTIKSKYNAISLWSGRNHGHISGKEFINLKVLILDRTKDDFEDNFFDGMTNLKVLVLKTMKFKKQLPMSLRSLKDKLTLLHLEDCELGEDISLIGELVNLVVLSFRKSKMKKFPANEIRRLSKLRVLDLHECDIASNGIPANVLKTLAKLEGFYGYGINRSDWADLTQKTNRDWKDFTFVLNRKDKNASLDELNKLGQLNVLEIEVPHLHQLPKNETFVKNLQHFYIMVGKKDEKVQISSKGFSRIMRFGYLESWMKANEYKCLETLLTKTDLLSLEEMKDTDFFVQKKETKGDTPEIKIDVAEYTNLSVLKMNGCDGMKGFAAKPLKAPNLTDIEVIKCNNLNFLFIEHKTDSRNEYNSFPLLKKLVLKKLGKLGCISSPDTLGNEAFPALFDGKVICPLLETLELVKCGQIMQIWSKSNLETSLWKRFKPSLNNLKDVTIKDCQKLQHVCSLAIAAALVHLKKLEIKSCSLLKTVIKPDKEENTDFTHSHNDNIKIFPALEELTLAECNHVKTFLSHKNFHGNQTFELPSLQKLRIQECPNMDALSSTDIKTPNLWWLTVEPCTHSKKEIANVNGFLKKQNKEPRKLNEKSSETNDVATNDLGKKSARCANFTCFGDKLKEPNEKKRE